MRVRAGVKIPLFDFGWLRLSFMNVVGIRQVSLSLSRPVPVPSNDLIVLTGGDIAGGAIHRITWAQVVTRPHVSRDNVSIRLRHINSVSSTPAYWRALELMMSTEEKCIDLRRLVNILRPRVLAQLAQTEAIELEVELVRDIDNPREVLSNMSIAYLFPLLGVLRRVCTYKVRSTMGKPAVMRALENYILASPKYADLKILRDAKVIREDGSLTMLGRVIVLALMPHALSEDDITTIESVCKS